MIFVDTSAWYALLSAGDVNHVRAKETLQNHRHEEWLTSSYVVVETMALADRRLGRPAAVAFHNDVLPVASIEWIDENLHRAGSAAYASGTGEISLVDRVSFEVMRRRLIRRAFAFDEDFDMEGFELVH